MKKKTIIRDYTTGQDKQGKTTYTYTGPVYRLGFDAEQWKRLLAAVWIAPVIGFALFICMGVLDGGGMKAFYVAVPFVTLFMPLSLMLGDAYKISIIKTKQVQRAAYMRSFVQLKQCTLAVIIITAVTVVGELIFMLVTDSTEITNDLFTVLLGLFLIGSMWYYLYLQRQWEKSIAEA